MVFFAVMMYQRYAYDKIYKPVVGLVRGGQELCLAHENNDDLSAS